MPADLANARAFIEAQFPVSKLSKESYKERKAGAGQTLTGLGKWWGRKPLVLVRAAILGLLLPATDDPAGDRETFLALMTMDDNGLLRRLKGSIPAGVVYTHATKSERERYFIQKDSKAAWAKGLTTEEKRSLQHRAFHRMGYDEKLRYCLRPEEIDGPSPEAWAKINAHLGTHAASLPELVRELGERRFGHTPRVGDVFSGGGSIPFEAARIGCDAYGSDLSPVAALLTWAALNIVGGGPEVVERVQAAQRRVYEAVRKQIDEWGIERNEDGWMADAYLYCNEVVDPITGWKVPLAPTWMVGNRLRAYVELVPDPSRKAFDFVVHEGASDDDLKNARTSGTWQGGLRNPVDAHGNLIPVHQRQTTSLDQLRGINRLRLWEKSDVIARADDLLQERLYCIRWYDANSGERHYRAPTDRDVERESLTLGILSDRMDKWQQYGFVPSSAIVPGDKLEEPIRSRGWTHWHQLFNPRQLLIIGLFNELADTICHDPVERVGVLLSCGRLADWASRLCRWNWAAAGGAAEKAENTFYNQALNPLFTFVARPTSSLDTTVLVNAASAERAGESSVALTDARASATASDIWITDPGYADAVNYEELSEFFLAWYEKRLPQLFPDWYTDSKRALAVRGKGESFRQAMVECYQRLAALMPDNGFQIVMFTHQDAEVWSDVALILWASGLQVTAAWTIATETESAGIKQGNYVQGTVLLVLRKRHGNPRGDLADIFPEVQAEVRRQLQSMLALDPKEDPNFGDADYQLAAYAAALRVLTGYAAVDEIDVEKEIYRTRGKGERSPLTDLIEKAVKIASDYLVPDGLDPFVWRKLGPEERLYMKGVEVEAHGEYREGVYQEFARGFGVGDYRFLLQSDAANQTRLKTPSEFRDRSRDPAADGFAGSLLRQVLFAVFVTAREEEPRAGRAYLNDALTPMGYWDNRQTILALLRYLAERPAPAMSQWTADVEAARLLYGFIQNDSV